MFLRIVLDWFALTLCLSVVHSSVIFDNSNSGAIVTYRLSNESIPENYFIYLETDIHTGTNFNYTGYVIIDIKIVRATNILRLHQRQINVDSVKILDSANKEISVTEFQSIDEYDFLDITLANELNAGDEIYKLTIMFSAPLRQFPQGFYRSYFNDTTDGEIHWLVATQFQSTNARYAFPCYDEPGLKSTFELEIKHHLTYTAISNYPGTRVDYGDDEYVLTKFDKTDRMSTYLLAFVVSDYISNDNVLAVPKQSVYTRRDAINQTELALEEGVKIIKTLEDYIGIVYRLEKLDQVSIPDIQPDAMENWGLVTYKENLLLFNKETGTLKQKFTIITTIAHEYGHQFFGNLVSPKWWSYVWLNEGFATLMEHYLPDLLYPTERYMDLFVIKRLQYSLVADGLITARPMTHYAESPSGISGLFDTVAYHKSGSVLRMIQHVLTDTTFKNGLKLYLDRCQLGVADSDDLFTAFTDANAEDLSVSTEYDLYAILELWTLQNGYPLLTVTQNREVGKVSLAQQRFLYVNNGAPSDEMWIIPFNYFTNSEEITTISWMPKQGEYDLELPLRESEWIIFNIQQTGYYRVNYDITNWELIIDYLTTHSNAFDKIGPINRAQLIDDSFNLARAGILPYEIPLKLMQYLAIETDYIPWASANVNFEYLRGLLLNTEVDVYWTKFINEVINSTLEISGYTPQDDESNFDILLRSLLVDWHCKLENPECLEFVNSALLNYFDNGQIDVNLKEQIFCYGLGTNGWIQFINLLFTPIDEAERVLILDSLGCIQDSTFLYVILMFTTLEELDFRRADRNRIFMSVLSKTKYGLDLAIDHVANEYEAIQNLYSGNKPINNLVVSMASYVRTASDAERFERELLNELQHIIDESAIESARNIISERLSWQIKYGGQIKDFLWKYYDVEDNEEEEEPITGGDGGASIMYVSISLIVVNFVIYISHVFSLKLQ